MDTRREGTRHTSILRNLNNCYPFKKQKEAYLKDPEFKKEMKEMKELAEKLDANNFKDNYKAVKKKINTIHKSFLQKLEKDEDKSKKAKTHYDQVCITFTYCNKATRFTGVETHREKFREAVQKYLDFIEACNVSNHGKERALQELLRQFSEFGDSEENLLAKVMRRELKNKVQKRIEIPINESYEGKKFLIIFTGGTIGSVTSADGRVDQPEPGSNETAADLLLGRFREKYGDGIPFDIDESLKVTLSENLISDKKLTLVKGIINILRTRGSQYDGVFITNGSDTLAYTTSLESMVLPKIKNEKGAPVPMFVVSANKPLDHPKSNGVDNLKFAVDTCVSVQNLPSAVFAIENWKVEGQADVICGSRATQCKPVRDTYGSLSANPESDTVSTRAFARITGNTINIFDIPLYDKLQERALQEKAPVDEISESPKTLTDRFLELETLTNRFQAVKEPVSGLNYKTYDLKEFDFFIQGPYHGGTACVEGNEENFLEFAKNCKGKGIQVFLGPLYGSEKRNIYGSTGKIHDEGIPIIMNITHEMLLEKVRLAYSLYPVDKKDLSGEPERHRLRMEFILEDLSYEWLLPGKTYIGPDRSGAGVGEGGS